MPGLDVKDVARDELGIDVENNSIKVSGGPGIDADGDEYIEGSSGETKFEKYKTNVSKKVPSGVTVSRNSVKIGPQGSLGDTNSTLAITLTKESGVYNIPATIAISSTGVVSETRTTRNTGAIRQVDVTPGTTNMEAVLGSGLYRLFSTAPIGGTDNEMVFKQGFKCGTTPPTVPVTYRVWENSANDDPDKLIVELDLPVNLWDGKSSGDMMWFIFNQDDLSGTIDKTYPILGLNGVDYYTELSSEAAFSMQGDGTHIQDSLYSLPVEFYSVAYHNPILTTATDIAHDASAHYYWDTTSASATLEVPYTAGAPFKISDSEKKFHLNNVVVEILNDVGGIAHTATLDNKNETWEFFKVDGVWQYREEGDGETVPISSDHVASVDFPRPSCVKFAIPSSTGEMTLNDDGVTWSKFTTMAGTKNVGFTSTGGTLTKTIDGDRLLVIGNSEAKVDKMCTIFYGLFVNGSLVEETEHTYGAAARYENLGMNDIADLDVGEYVEVKVRGDGTANVKLTAKSLDVTFWSRGK